ncbi:ATP-grasp domain-containing protein [Paenibacillus sp. GCM10012307]|uniref:ATP-grasp domain-containing protein n=1 Tax=Paenibacillus roseus TaxID=2798579 RepID=A0A934J8G8_9BACL|nr:ATP-grasp domain-containing protein [Paenibacillus roseus]MBJ6363739.1 ATP-grasp domain-containing protein [Paenibacillus roseus]
MNGRMLNLEPFRKAREGRVLWHANINEDQHWNENPLFPSFAKPQHTSLIEQQEQQLLWIAEPEDVVWLLHAPDAQFLADIKRHKGELPHLCISRDAGEVAAFIAGAVSGLCTFMPFMLTPEFVVMAETHGWRLMNSDARKVKELNSKYTTRRLAEEHGFAVTNGRFCMNLEELDGAYQAFREAGFDQAVLKQAYGSSGKGLTIIENEHKFKQLSVYIRKRTASFELLLEAWHPIRQSLNAQLWIEPDAVHLLAVTEQRINAYGVYIGTNYAPHYEADVIGLYRTEMLRLGEVLRKLGYRGIAGIDSIVDHTGTLYPVIEINARFTQVTYLLPLIESLLLHYRHVESRYIRLESSDRLAFESLKEKLESVLRPDSDHQFTIYTFACSQEAEKCIYRIFVLFYGNEASRLQEMLEVFERFPALQEQSAPI